MGIFDRCPAATHRGGTPCQAQMVTTAFPPAPVATLFAVSPSHRSWRASSPSAPFPSRQQDPSPYRRHPVSHRANRRVLALCHRDVGGCVLVPQSTHSPRRSFSCNALPAPHALAPVGRRRPDEPSRPIALSAARAAVFPRAAPHFLRGSGRLTRRCSGPGCNLVLPGCVQLATPWLPVARGSRAAERQR